MTTPFPPTLADLERRLGVEEGSLDGVDRARAQAALDDAVALASAEVPNFILERWATSSPSVASVVVLKAARREFENPRGYVSATAGDVGGRVETATGVYLTREEITQLKRAAGLRTGRVGSVYTPASYGR